MDSFSQKVDRAQEWRARLAVFVAIFIVAETLSGLFIWLLPFSVTNQIVVIVHTVFGLIGLAPLVWYAVRHWRLYRSHQINHIKLLGYIGLAFLGICGLSGLVLTVQAAFQTRISYFWDAVHIVMTFGILAFVIPHVVVLAVRLGSSSLQEKAAEVKAGMASYGKLTVLGTVVIGLLVALAGYAYDRPKLQHDFPDDYSFKYGNDRPFAPSLARTDTGNAFDPRSLAGSHSCGTAGCHEEIVHEWEVSAHRYAAMDVGFQKIQLTMAQQNGSESTRYCGGCHDPISLFSGTKNIYTDTDKLTSMSGYQEGVSCLGCHAVRRTDLKGNAQYVVTEPVRYMFELEYQDKPSAAKRFARDFLIRSYPRQHVQALSKRLFKTPEYCAACHKQFIDKEINNVGWVQLQNQYDNWRKSKWNHPGKADRTIECRECHMPLTDTPDPAAGDPADYNRTPSDGKHRSHRFVAANQFMPRLLKLPGWQKQVELTEKWLQGEYQIPEIAHKWSQGPAVIVELIAPEATRPGEPVSLKAVITSNKVGHDFPTGPLDIIQAWLEVIVTDGDGKQVFSTGVVDKKGFIAPGSFIFKAEPVDQYGNLIDRHNLWEMVGVRQRRALFPGFSDTTDFNFLCPGLGDRPVSTTPQNREEKRYRFSVDNQLKGNLRVVARLKYRKIDQFLLNFIAGENSGLTSPVTEMSRTVKTIRVSTAGI